MTDTSSNRPKGNLPAETTSVVGRRHEIIMIKQLLSTARLVTVTGVGGVGKTRLALRVARTVQRAFTDGVYLVDLAGLQDPGLVAHTVSEALEIRDHTEREQPAVLIEHLRKRHLLLVLDNCEHLVDACAQLVDTLLGAAPGLQVLATSRHALGSAGEHVWQVMPLPAPDPEESQSPQTGETYAALALFAERAAAAAPGFSITRENRADVARLCHRLDGLPLAIELAAVRLRTLGVTEILERLEDRYRLLNAGHRGGQARQQTLRAAVDWSFDLCSQAEQTIWARLSVFARGFDLEAAEEVCAGYPIAREDVVDLVDKLVKKSVLVRDEHAGQARYRLLETIREYGRDKLRLAGQEAAVRRRHRDWYARLSEQGEAEWFGPRQAEWFTRVRLEYANIRAALDFCLTTPGEARAGLHMAGVLWFHWAGCGVLGEGRHWLGRALALSPEPTTERAKALWVNGYVATLQGDLTSAVSMLEECRGLAWQTGDETALAYSIHRLGCVALVGDDLPYATALFEEAQARYAALGELNSTVMLAAVELAIAATFQGDLDRADAHCTQAREIGEKHGEQWAYACATCVLALVALNRGELSQASRYGRDCLRIKQGFNDLLGIVLAVEVLAWTAGAAGDWERAAVLLGAARQIWRGVGYPLFGSKYFSAPHQDCEVRARQSLGHAVFEDTFRRGSEFTLDEAIDYALGENARTTVAACAGGEKRGPPSTPLTPRERQVAELVAQGLSNKDIAARLVIAQRTAEGHVQRILVKLGFTSRTRLATWIARQQQQ